METQTEELVLIEKDAQTKYASPYTSLIQEVEIHKLRRIVSQYKKETIPYNEHKKLFNKFDALTKVDLEATHELEIP